MNNEKIIEELNNLLNTYDFEETIKNDILNWIEVLGNNMADENDKEHAKMQATFLIKYLKKNKKIRKIRLSTKYQKIIKKLEKISAKKSLDESIKNDILNWINTLNNENADENDKYFAEILGEYLINDLQENPDIISSKRVRK